MTFKFCSVLNEKSISRIAPDGTPHFAASLLRLCCLPMSHMTPGLYELILEVDFFFSFHLHPNFYITWFVTA